MKPDKRASIRACFIMILAISLIYGMPFDSLTLNNKTGTGIGGAEANIPDRDNLIFLEENGQGGFQAAINSGIAEPELYSKAQVLLYTTYNVKRGDTISEIAKAFGLNQDSLISLNGIRDTRRLQIGQELKIPNQDGIIHRVNRGETLAALAKKYESEDRKSVV